jgi:hypothetical protein
MTKKDRIPRPDEPVNVQLARGRLGPVVKVADELWLFAFAEVRVVLLDYGLTLDLGLRLIPERGSYEVDALTVLRLQGGPNITKTLLGRLQLDDVLSHVVGYLSVGARAEALRQPLEPVEDVPDVGPALNQRKRLDPNDPEVLAEVARLWHEAPTPKHEYVGRHIHKSDRQASRLITKAKEAGLIPTKEGTN